MDEETFPSLTRNASDVFTQSNGIGSFAQAVQLEPTSVLETKTMDTPDSPVFQSNVGRRMEDNRMHGLWTRLIREDVQPRSVDDPIHDRYIHVYQVKYEQTFNQEEYYSEGSEEDTEEDTDVEE